MRRLAIGSTPQPKITPQPELDSAEASTLTSTAVPELQISQSHDYDQGCRSMRARIAGTIISKYRMYIAEYVPSLFVDGTFKILTRIETYQP
jgi:hypothetical protein